MRSISSDLFPSTWWPPTHLWATVPIHLNHFLHEVHWTCYSIYDGLTKIHLWHALSHSHHLHGRIVQYAIHMTALLDWCILAPYVYPAEQIFWCQRQLHSRAKVKMGQIIWAHCLLRKPCKQEIWWLRIYTTRHSHSTGKFSYWHGPNQHMFSTLQLMTLFVPLMLVNTVLPNTDLTPTMETVHPYGSCPYRVSLPCNNTIELWTSYFV